MNRAFALLFALVVVVSLVPSTTAYTISDDGGLFEEDFEEYSTTGGLDANYTRDSVWVLDTTEAQEGSNSILFDDNDNAEVNTIVADETVDFANNSSISMTYYFLNKRSASSTDITWTLTLNDGVRELRAGYRGDNAGDDNWRLEGSLLTGGTATNTTDPNIADRNVWNKIEVEVEPFDNEVRMYVNGTLVITATGLNEWDNGSNIQVGLRSDASGNSIGDDDDANFDNITVNGDAVFGGTTGLEIDARSFMEHGSSQDYQVFLTNDTGTHDVSGSDDLSVTSSDGSIVSVDEDNATLTATSDESVNQEITLTAEWKGGQLTDTQDITVANKTLDNIAILPPPTWPSAIFGSPGGTEGASSTWPGAVQLQWIFVALSIGAVVSWKARVGMLGALVVLGMLTFGWAIDWVADGMLIAAIIFMVYALAVLCGKSRSAGEVVGGFC